MREKHLSGEKRGKPGKSGNHGKWKNGILEEWNVGGTFPPPSLFYPAKLAKLATALFYRGFCALLSWPLSWSSWLSSWPENEFKRVANQPGIEDDDDDW